MYAKVDEAIEKFVRKQGEIVFAPPAPKQDIQFFTSYVKYSIRYTYHGRDKSDRLGVFYLGLNKCKKYHMGGLALVRECDPGLQIFFLDMVVENAIKEALGVSAQELVIISKEKFIVETFLNYGFKVDPIGSPAMDEKTIYKGTKHLRQKEKT